MAIDTRLLHGRHLANGTDLAPRPIEIHLRAAECSVLATGDDWLRTRESPRGFASFARPDGGRREEIVLSSTQLLSAVAVSLCGIFLFVWALSKLWLFGR
jgi:hypothetical protein